MSLDFGRHCFNLSGHRLTIFRRRPLPVPAPASGGSEWTLRCHPAEPSRRELAWPNGSSGRTASWQVERRFAKRLGRFVNGYLKTSVPSLSVGSRESPWFLGLAWRVCHVTK